LYEDRLPAEIISKVESDLRKYPDWIVRIEMGGLGIPQRYEVTGSQAPSDSRHSYIEDEVELSDETQRKVKTIEAVFDRLRGKTKDIIQYRYFMNFDRDEILTKLVISKRQYYNRRDQALESFARALGYIE
jgi:DNA-directed RNA polymerase specialized sigma subunit